MSEPKAVYEVEPMATVDESGVSDRPQSAEPITQEIVSAGEEAAQQKAEQQPETQEADQAEAVIVGELQASMAARDAQIAELKARLAEAEQRAALPPLAGNPAVSDAPVEAHGYDLIRKAIESGQMPFGF